MKCRDFKKWIGEYVDGELAGTVKAECDSHVLECAACRKEYEVMARAWDAAGHLPSIEPSPAFVSHFWTKVATQESTNKNAASVLQNIFARRRWVPAAVVLSVAIIIASLGSFHHEPVACDISMLGGSDAEFAENVELAEHLDVIKDMDWLQDLDVIQEMDAANV